jgi:ABC-type uncharacterized transport system permease subunit
MGAAYWDAVLRVTCPIGLAAIGVLLCSRAGILLVGVEGVMLSSAFFSIAGASWFGSVWFGAAIGLGVGVITALVLGLLSITLRMGDIVGGLVLHVGAIGATGFLLAEWFPNGLTTGGELLRAPWPETGASGADVVVHQQPLFYVMIALALALWVFLATKWGLRVRASGESMRAARSFGVQLVHLRFTVLAASGAVIGLAGALIGVGIVGTFDTGVVGGRGFIALACVVLAAWKPLWIIPAAALFGAAYALQFRVANDTLGGWLQIVPYALVIVALAARGRRQGPAEEGKGLYEEVR